jgi:multimeric flavodoxin WrbA
MRTVILDGDPRDPDTPLDRALSQWVRDAQERGDVCEQFHLRDLKLHQCVGCLNCFLKSPGRCRLRDDGARIVAAVAQADLVVFAAPMRMGFTSALLKRATDRIVPNVLPYIEVVDGECRHPMRYGHGIDLALVVERGDATVEELAATEFIYQRLAKNLHGRFAWVMEITEGSKEVRHALDAA